MGQSLQILPSRVPALPATVHWGAVADYTAYVAVTLHTDLHHWVACWSLFWWCTCTQTHSPPLFMSPNSLSHVHGCAVIWLCFKANGVLQKKTVSHFTYAEVQRELILCHLTFSHEPRSSSMLLTHSFEHGAKFQNKVFPLPAIWYCTWIKSNLFTVK